MTQKLHTMFHVENRNNILKDDLENVTLDASVQYVTKYHV